MKNAIIFPPKLVDIQNYYYFKEGFSNEELDKIYADVAFLPFKAGETGSSNELTGVLDAVQYTEYHATENGHYGWHQDFGPGMLSTRKISVTVQLSDPSEYEGGDLEYFIGGDPNNALKVQRDKGLVFIFPSYMMHRVTPVTKGIRRSFVLWVGGEHYK
jgi:PKHD-type hydroxylase